MTKMRDKLVSAGAGVLLASMTAPAMAGSSDFSGLFIGAQGSVNGMELDGKHTDQSSETQTGSGGAFAMVAGIEAGFNIPLGDSFFVGVGGMWIPVDASFDANDNEGNADVTLTSSSHVTWYIQPSISVYDNSAIYLKIGSSEADLTSSGDVTGQPNNLEGSTLAIGTTTLFGDGGGLYMRTEAGYHEYDHIKLTGVGGSSTAILEGDPTVAYGSVSLGIQF